MTCQTPACESATEAFMCTRHVAETLRLLTHAEDTLDMVRETRASTGGVNRSAGGASRPPCPIDAIEAATELDSALNRVARMLRCERGRWTTATQTIPRTPGLWMSTSLVETALKSCQRSLEKPREKQLIGPCGGCDEGTLHSFVGEERAWCDACGAVYMDGGMIKIMRAAHIHRERMNILAAVKTFNAAGLTLATSTAYLWVKNGHVPADENGEILLGDLITTYQRPPKRGKKSRLDAP